MIDTVPAVLYNHHMTTTTETTDALKERIRSAVHSVSEECGAIEIAQWTPEDTQAVGLALIKLYERVLTANKRA